MTTLIESQAVERDYGMNGTQAIIDTEKHGRLFIEDGFGGIDSLSGGSVRWRHGAAYKIAPTDTIEQLTELQFTRSGYPFRELENLTPLPWDGFVLESIAESVGL